MRFIDNIRLKKGRLQAKKRGGEKSMFGNELTMGSIRAQSENLKKILAQLESDENWPNNSAYYSKELRDVERCLRIIRRKDFESINICEVCGV
jgi:hypothetical protein